MNGGVEEKGEVGGRQNEIEVVGNLRKLGKLERMEKK